MRTAFTLAFLLTGLATAFATTTSHKYFREGDAGVPSGTAFGIGLIGAVSQSVTNPQYPSNGYKQGYYGRRWYTNPYWTSDNQGE